MSTSSAPDDNLASPERFGGDTRVTHAMEDYLKAAYTLEQEGGPVTTLRLAEAMGLSGPSVTNMIKRLDELKLVVHNPYHGISLTPSGRGVALEVIRHHRLLELYLSRALGYEWDEVHQEAERLEHHVSEELERRMERALDYPEFDPHGDPIPTRAGTIPAVEDVALPDLTVGARATISRVSDRDAEKLRYMSTHDLRPGTSLTVRDRLPYDGPILVEIHDDEQLVPFAIACLVRVHEEDPSGAS
ncbi:MAG: metal-dependent transcriptional regulator [Chloroflexota bacterium]|nr:metal-dependent transcriptional regulator [Chloroflexota bacterium]